MDWIRHLILDPENTSMWIAINTIAASFGTLALIATVYLSNKAMRDSMKTFNNNMEAAVYSEMDSMYMDLLKIGLEKPYLRDPASITDPAQSAAYDCYAYMMWNYLESIHDRCLGDKILELTWAPVFKSEKRLHLAWFNDEKNAPKFKSKFREFVEHGSFNE